MRVWFDILTPKHTLFFEPLCREIANGRNEMLITTRVYREAVEALRLRRLPFRIVGEHGGGTKLGKLLASGSRVVKLARLVEDWKPDVSISFSSPEAARVAFGLGIPHVAANDSPHSWHVARLSIPLSRYVCSPWLVRRRVWLSFGARADGIVSYRALDAAAWLKGYRPNSEVLRQLSLDRGRPIILLRTEESYASYLEGKASDAAPVISPVVDEILRLKLDVQIVISTRYGRQAPALRRRFGNKVRVIDHIVDSTSLLYYSTLFIGSGGTMTVEAALMGKLAISCFPGPRVLYLDWLEKQRVMQTVFSPRRIAKIVGKTLGSGSAMNGYGRRGIALLKKMEDPTTVLSRVVNRALNER